MNHDKTAEAFQQLVDIITMLRSPEGCPWDREQTPDSIKGNLLEETYECIDAIIENDDPHLREELGDLYLLVTMLSYMKQEEGSFTIEDVLIEISEKLKRRHPHVFSDVSVSSPQEVIENWNAIKRDVEGKRKDSIMDEVPRTIPPLERAYLLQKKAAKVGFDWKDTHDVWKKIDEELSELKEAFSTADKNELEAELGDFIFSIVNISRFLDIDPALALHRTNEKFKSRFSFIEKRMKADGVAMNEGTMQIMDDLWNEIKQREKSS